jgi:hypothetical protein
MTIALFRSGLPVHTLRSILAIVCVIALLPGDSSLFAQQGSQSASQQGEAAGRLPPDQLDSLVAPIALYPDPLLSQTLVASTYPLEVIQLQQWLEKNKGLKDQALVDAVKKQNWDASVQALAALTDVVKRLSENITWTTDLGNAFLAQQSDVMDAVQRMRKKAQGTGNLKSSEQQKVETKVIENKEVVIIEQAKPEVVYVPSYDPVVVYGAASYPYPPLYYPPPGYYAAGMAISFGIGMAMGAAWGGGWGWGCGWGGNNNVYINNNNNFVRNSNRQNFQGGNRNQINPQGRSNWQHDARHRGGAPYSSRDVANRYGGSARGDSMASRRDNARRNQGQRGNFERASDRMSNGGRQPGTRDGTGSRDFGGRNAGAGVSDRSANRGGGDRVGNRSTSGGGGSRGASAFGGSGGFSGSSAKASSSRGSSSMGGSRGGGSRGGGRRR